MKALITKELCELQSPAAFVLAVAAAIGTLDFLYNLRGDHFVGVSLGFCLVGAYIIALLAGANALGRESRDNLAFLASWPIRRDAAWVVKLLVNLVVAGGTVVLSFAICFVLVRMDGFTGLALQHFFADPGLDVFIPLWFAAYALGFCWSALVRVPMAAAGLAGATAVALLYGLSYILFEYLPDRWGPWLGFDLDALRRRDRWPLIGIALAIVAASAFAASGLAFVRSPVLEARRRLVRGVAWLLGMTLALTAVGIAVYWFATRPSLSQLSAIQLSPDGKRLVVTTTGYVPGLWTEDIAAGGKPVLVARGQPGSGESPFVRVAWHGGDGAHWMFIPNAGNLIPLPGHAGNGLPCTSPSGRLICYPTSKGLVVIDAQGHLVRSFRPSHLEHEMLTAFPDERYVYTSTMGFGKHMAPRASPTTILTRYDIRTGQSNVLSSPPGAWGDLAFSPSGRLAVETVGSGDASAVHLVILDVQTGARHRFDDIVPTRKGWVGDDRHLWARSAADARLLRIVDTQTMRVVRSIGPAEYQAAPGNHFSQADAQLQFPSGLRPRRDDGPIYFDTDSAGSGSLQRYIWAANPDGTGLRYVMRYAASAWVGVDADGDFVFWKPTVHEVAGKTTGVSSVVSVVNPTTKQEHVLFSVR